MIEALRTRGARGSLGALVFAAAVVALAGLSLLWVVVEVTDQDAFCLVCHVSDIGLEIADHPHGDTAEARAVRCADCHLPQAFGPRVVAKMDSGLRDVRAHILGTIDTPEKFEAERMRLAKKTWRQMKENDSQACRHCHDPTTWDLSTQTGWAQRYHEMARADERTCITCHKGFAHALPEGIRPFDAIEGIDF